MFNGGTEIGIGFEDIAGMREAKRGAVNFSRPSTGHDAKVLRGSSHRVLRKLGGPWSAKLPISIDLCSSHVHDLPAGVERDTTRVFIDEIDAIGSSRLKGNGMGGNGEREHRLNQLLVEVNSFSTTRNVVNLMGVLRTRGG